MRAKHNYQSATSNDAGKEVSSSRWNEAHDLSTTVASKTGDYTIVDDDCGKIIRAAHSSALVFTLPATSAVADDWSIWIENRQTGAGSAGQLTIDGNSTETVDGVASIYTYSGDLRLLRKTGTGASGTWESILFRGGTVQVTTAGGTTLYWPSGATWVRSQLWGGGGGGACGERGNTTADRWGGGGGGGGGYQEFTFNGATYAASTAITATCGAGGAGAAGRTTDGSPNAGGTGGSTTIAISGGLTAYAYGGTGGGNQDSRNGGAGGSGAGATYRSYAPPGNNSEGIGTGDTAGGKGWMQGAGSATFGYTGGGGGGTGYPRANANEYKGAKSLLGGAGGGGGGYVTITTGLHAGGGAGGSSFSTVTDWSSGDTWLGGGAAAGGSGAAGSAGSSTPTAWGPDIGGGGGGGHTTTPGAGGAGGRCCGGGGGGATNTGTASGAGGNGGDGLIRFSYG